MSNLRLLRAKPSQRGYTSRMAARIRQADRKLVGVQLGRICLKQDIAVASVATYLAVSRQIVYRWFSGEAEPREHMHQVVRLLEALVYRDS
jgi:DNA-binding transcriptional regulator YiaG